MSEKSIIFLASNDDKLLSELEDLLDKNKYHIESFTSEVDCIKQLDKYPDIILIDYKLNYNAGQKEQNSVEIIENIKQKKLPTRIFMFSNKESARIYVDMIENK